MTYHGCPLIDITNHGGQMVRYDSYNSNLTRRLRQKENKDAIKASLSVLVEKVMRMDMGMGDLPMIMNVLVDEINF